MLSPDQDPFFAANLYENFGDLGAHLSAYVSDYSSRSASSSASKIETVGDMKRFVLTLVPRLPEMTHDEAQLHTDSSKSIPNSVSWAVTCRSMWRWSESCLDSSTLVISWPSASSNKVWRATRVMAPISRRVHC